MLRPQLFSTKSHPSPTGSLMNSERWETVHKQTSKEKSWFLVFREEDQHIVQLHWWDNEDKLCKVWYLWKTLREYI